MRMKHIQKKICQSFVTILRSTFLCISVCALITIMLSGCLQIQNSFEDDDTLFKEQTPLDEDDPAQLRLQNVRQIFSSAGCVKCHVDDGQGNLRGFLTYSDNDWANNGYVVFGDLNASTVYTALYQTDCPPGRCDMPYPPYSALTDEELQIIENWILQSDSP